MTEIMIGIYRNNLPNKYRTDPRMSAITREALHIATGDHVIQTFQAANVCAVHDNRITLKLKDLKLVEKMSNGRTNY